MLKQEEDNTGAAERKQESRALGERFGGQGPGEVVGRNETLVEVLQL